MPDVSAAADLAAAEARRHGPTALGRFLYFLGRWGFRVIFAIGWGLKITGRENVPREGSLLLAANHTSWADPPLVGSTSPRDIHFMAKQELFEVPFFGWLIRQTNAFPIKRVERDVSAFRTAQRILEHGGVLIVFPEGTRQRDGRFGKPKSGVAMLSVKTGTPVVPVYVHNAHRLTSMKRLEVHFGRPIAPDPGADYAQFSEKIMAAIAALKEAAHGSAG